MIGAEVSTTVNFWPADFNCLAQARLRKLKLLQKKKKKKNPISSELIFFGFTEVLVFETSWELGSQPRNLGELLST